MKKFFALSVVLSLCFCGCSRSASPRYYASHSQTAHKVALAAVSDVADCSLPWDVSEEFTQELRAQCRGERALSLSSDKRDLPKVDFFAPEEEWVGLFSGGDFAVVTELVEHQTIPYARGKIRPLHGIQGRPCQSVLMMKMRLKIMDLRGETPQLLLQEVIPSNHMIARGDERFDYGTHCWGSSLYQNTPYANAHKVLVGEVIERIEGAIKDAQ